MCQQLSLLPDDSTPNVYRDYFLQFTPSSDKEKAIKRFIERFQIPPQFVFYFQDKLFVGPAPVGRDGIPSRSQP